MRATSLSCVLRFRLARGPCSSKWIGFQKDYLSSRKQCTCANAVFCYDLFMILTDVKLIHERDVAKYAWGRIGKFQNVEFCTSRIVRNHRLPQSQIKNARNQAEEIKYCLNQAKEYAQAAASVSLATRPVLLYYSAMSMALAEILFKQTADSRLAKLREKHPAHGLVLRLAGIPGCSDSLASSANRLIAIPQMSGAADAIGTFEVWRKSARESPIGGNHTEQIANVEQSRYAMLLIGEDKPLRRLPKQGLTLLDCLRELPYLADTLHGMGDYVRLVRTTITRKSGANSFSPLLVVVVHPSPPEVVAEFLNRCRFSPSRSNDVEIIMEGASQLVFTVNLPNASGSFHLPSAISTSEELTYFSCSNIGLNEFGYLYAALHICGNFARYYPDIWLRHIEKSSDLCLAIDDLCAKSLERLPLLLLSELTSSHHVTT